MYQFNKLILPIIFIFFTNCGFKVLDKSTLDKIKINEINTAGDKKINFLIKSKIIKLSDPNSLGELINIDIDSKKNKNIKEKNKQNKITKYQKERNEKPKVPKNELFSCQSKSSVSILFCPKNLVLGQFCLDLFKMPKY